MSAFGSAGPDAERPAYDLIAQALSGLLLAQPRPGDAVPRRLGGLALADFTAGLLAALSVVAGLLAREERAPELEVSLLGAALTLQAQRFVAVEERDAANGPARAVGAEELARLAAAGEARERARSLLPRSRLPRRPGGAGLPQRRRSGVRSARCSASRTAAPPTRRPSPPTRPSAANGLRTPRRWSEDSRP